MARIVSVYRDDEVAFPPSDASLIHWIKIAESLCRLGHDVDVATRSVPEPKIPYALRAAEELGASPDLDGRLRRIRLRDVRWEEYDVVKTVFHRGFETLRAHGGADHPFIVSELGSVVAPEDRDGIYFYGATRRRLFAVQQEIARTSACVTVLSRPAQELWESCFGPEPNVLVVPGAADADLPRPSADPFPDPRGPRCIFAGHVYFPDSQPEANRVIVDKLNRLGGLLNEYGIRLYMIGSGDLSRLDPRCVRHLGVVPHQRAWDYLRFADVGVVVALGPHPNVNESTKIYHYLRVGLPVVSEAGFPNDHVVQESRLGFVVQNGNLELMAEKVREAAVRRWDRVGAMRYVLAHHTWDRRVEIYDAVIRARLSERVRSGAAVLNGTLPDSSRPCRGGEPARVGHEIGQHIGQPAPGLGWQKDERTQRTGRT